MAHGDVGGSITELVITCVTPRRGAFNIMKGDPVSLVVGGAYEVEASDILVGTLFGQSLANMTENDAAIPIKVRGICIFSYSGNAPRVDGVSGVKPSMEHGMVEHGMVGNGLSVPSLNARGIVLKVDTAAREVHVLI